MYVHTQAFTQNTTAQQHNMECEHCVGTEWGRPLIQARLQDNI